MLVLAASLFVSLLTARVEDPPSVTVDTDYDNGMFMVKCGTSAGPTAKLFIASSTKLSGASLEGLADQTTDIKIGDVVIGNTKFNKDADTEGDGYIGMDVLSKMAVGFDIASRKITFFPGGKLTSEFATKWVTSGAPVPNQAAPPVTAIPIEFDDETMPVVSVKVGEKSYRAFLMTYMFNTYFASDPAPDEPTFALKPSGKVGPLTIPWFTCSLDKENADLLKETQLSAMLSMDNLYSERVIFDFSGGKVYAADASTDVKLAGFLSHVSRTYYQIEDDVIRLINYDYKGTPLEGLGGLKVSSIAGEETANILKYLRSADDGGAAWLKTFFDKVQAEHKVVVVDADGKEKTFTVPAAEE